MMKNKAMWVLHICHSYYPPFLDCARQYCALFKDTPYQVLTVYLTGDEDVDVAAQTASDEVIFLGYKSKQVRGLKLGAITTIRRIAQKRQFQFCIAHRVKPTYVALLATQLPVISVHHSYDDYQRWARRLLVNFYQNRLLMIGVSNDVRDDLRRDLHHWDPQRIQTLYNHIDVKQTRSLMQNKDGAREALGLSQHGYIIANVGRLHHDKDQTTLINAFQKSLPHLPDKTLLYIAGKGPMENALKRLAQTLKIEDRVIFAGHVADVRRYFKAFDLFVLSSDREPFGMVLLEAMAAELPIVCSDCGGGAEVVANIDQQLFPFGNEEALSLCMIKAAKNQFTHNSDTMLAKLEHYFSDQAVKAQFWQLPVVERLTQK